MTTFPYEGYLAHPGRNPLHIPFGKPPGRSGKNPSRWLPHVGGARAGARPTLPDGGFPAVPDSRQVRRTFMRQVERELNSEAKAHARKKR
jgi:hypothetical protein